MAVEAIGNLRLRMSIGFILDLCDVLYVPSLRRSLISVSQLVSFAFAGDNENVKIFFKNNPSNIIGICVLVNDLW